MTTRINLASSNNSLCLNQTCRRRPPMFAITITTADIVSAVFFGILILLIVSGNSLVIGSFRVNRRLRTKTNYFIMSLAFADLAIGLISVPTWNYLSLKKIGIPVELGKFYQCLDVVVGVASILNLTMISLERGYALMRPIQHRSISKVTIIFAIVTAWSLAIFAGGFRFMTSPEVTKSSYGIVVTVVFFFVPLTIILVTYTIIFRIASAHARGRGVRSFKKDLRIAMTVAVVIGFFTIAWTPFFSLNFFFTVCGHHSVKLCRTVPPALFPVVKWMQYGNSACNPIIYGFRNKDFKIAFKKIVYKMFGKEVAISSYSRSTYVGRTTRGRFVRSESSYDGSQSVVIYPDQIVPPGMYDMRESYRSAITHGYKKRANPKPQRKGLAQGLMTLNVETFSMPTSHDVTANTNQSVKSSDDNPNTADTIQSQDGVQSSSDIDVYPMDETTVSRDNGVVNEGFVENVGVAKVKRTQPRFHVHFGDSNGVVNGGLVNDDSEKTENSDSSPNLSNPGEKERSNPDVITPNSQNETDDEADKKVNRLTVDGQPH